jgi:autotransporter-associated beta strand protein
VFGNGADVTFDDSGSNSPAITLAGSLQPDSIVVNAIKSYTLGGSGLLAGPMTVLKTNAGALTINTTNSFTGGLTLSSGALTLGDASSAGSGTLTLNGGNLTLNGAGAPATFANPTVVSATSTVTVAASGNQAISGALSGSNRLNLSVGNGGTFSFRGSMSSFSGTIAMIANGTLRFYGSATGSSSAAFDTGTGSATLRTRDGGTVSFGSLSGGAGTTLNGATSSDVASTYNIGGNHVSTTFAGTITNGANALRTVAINKVGLGTLSLSGVATHTGPTTVSAGALLVNGDHSAATNNVTVIAAATLGGAGMIGGNATINGTLAPGAGGIGTLTVNKNLFLGTNSSSLFEISKNPLTNDIARVFGQLTFGGSLNVVNVSPDLLDVGDTFKLFDATNSTGSFASFTLPVLDQGRGWDISTLYVDGRISIVATNPPLFLNIAAAPLVTSAIVSWDTSSNTTSQVEYGFTTSYEHLSLLNPALTTAHAILLTGLAPDTNYFFRVRAQSGTNILRSGGFIFSTSGTLILDNPDATYSGNWILGTSSTDKYGSYYEYTAATADPSPSAQANYSPNILAPGKYDVFIWYPAGPNRATNVPVSIFGQSAFVGAAVNQTTNGGSWQLLASSVDFSAGTSGLASIGNNSGNPNTIVMADAMRWSYVLSQDNPADGSVPDWWANFYFGGPADGSADPDGDDLSNYAEFIMGTDPTDPSSYLRFTINRSASTIQVGFNPWLAGRIYQLSSTTNLMGNSWTLLPNLPASTGLDAFFTLTNSFAPRFYRLGVRLQ